MHGRHPNAHSCIKRSEPFLKTLTKRHWQTQVPDPLGFITRRAGSLLLRPGEFPKYQKMLKVQKNLKMQKMRECTNWSITIGQQWLLHRSHSVPASCVSHPAEEEYQLWFSSASILILNLNLNLILNDLNFWSSWGGLSGGFLQPGFDLKDMISVRKGKVYKKVVKYGLLSKPYQTPPSPLVFFLSVRTFFGFLRQSWEDQTVLFAKFTKICPDDENDDDENDDD